MGERPKVALDGITVWLSRAGGTARQLSRAAGTARGSGGDGDDQRVRARALLLAAASAALGVPDRELTVVSEPSGRPRVRRVCRADPAGEDTGLHVALSHTAGAVAVAVSGLGPVGVDAETLRPMPALALARRWLSEAEARWLAEEPVDTHTIGFLLLWTQKEAVGKALGVGLRGSGLRRLMPLPPYPSDPGPSGADPSGAVARQVPGLAGMSVAGWRVPGAASAQDARAGVGGVDGAGELVLAVACDAPGSLTAPIVLRAP